MSYPQLGVEIDFSNGASFGYPFILDDPAFGILGTNILADAAADLVTITDQVLSGSIRRGRNRILSNFEVGTATVTINDPNSDFNPQNTASPYFGKLLPLRKIRLFALQPQGTIMLKIYIFSGYITTYDTSFYEGTNQTSTVTLQCADGFRLLNNVSTGVAPVAGAPAGQLSGARVNDLLDAAIFPNSLRNIDVGQSTMQADPGGDRSILAAIQTVEQSEFGAFFMSRQGEAKFLDRNTVSELADFTPRIYSDVPGPGVLTYSNVDFAYDDQLILNDVTVTRLGGIPQEIVSVPSIETYFTKSGQRSGILVQTDAEALDQARTILAARKNADLRIDSMSLNLYSTDNEDEKIINLTMDTYTLINITKSMPGGSSITRELFVQGVQHDVKPGIWNMKLLTAEPIIQAFILDSTNQGILALTDPPNNNALSY
jgi:hypothetical protein